MQRIIVYCLWFHLSGNRQTNNALSVETKAFRSLLPLNCICSNNINCKQLGIYLIDNPIRILTDSNVYQSCFFFQIFQILECDSALVIRSKFRLWDKGETPFSFYSSKLNWDLKWFSHFLPFGYFCIICLSKNS